MLDVFKQKEAHPVNRFIINWILLKCLYRDPAETAHFQYLGSSSTPIFQLLFKDSFVSPPPAPHFNLECYLHFSKSNFSNKNSHQIIPSISSFSFIYYESVSFYE